VSGLWLTFGLIKKDPNVLERIFGSAADLWIRCQPFECRHHYVSVELAMDPSNVAETGCRKGAHVRVLVAEEGQAAILYPPPIRVVEGHTYQRIANLV
jgi:hypothetical protein